MQNVLSLIHQTFQHCLLQLSIEKFFEFQITFAFFVLSIPFRKYEYCFPIQQMSIMQDKVLFGQVESLIRVLYCIHTAGHQ